MQAQSTYPLFNQREVSRYCRRALANGCWQPLILLGPPGGGKTYFFEEVLPLIWADVLGIDVSKIKVISIKPGTKDCAELSGVSLPYEDENGNMYTEFALSPVLVKIEKAFAEGYTHIILLWDEVANAQHPEQKAIADTFHPTNPSIGDRWSDRPGNIIVCGTGNRAKDKSGSLNLLSIIANRAIVAMLERDVQGWHDDFAVPNNVNPIIREVVLAFADDGIFADEVPATPGPFSSERTMTSAGKQLDAIMAEPEFTGTLSAFNTKCLAMNIGWDSAKRVEGYIARRDKVPTGPEIIADPSGALVPDETGFQLLAGNLAIAEVSDANTAAAALHYLVRLRKDLRVSLGVKLMTVCTENHILDTSPLAQSFLQEYNDFLPLAQD